MRVRRAMILAGATILLGIAPSTAQRYDPNYPVCLQKWQRGGSNTIYCYYTSWDQCRAAASGTASHVSSKPVLVASEQPGNLCPP